MRWVKYLIGGISIGIVITIVMVIVILNLDSYDYKKLLISWANSVSTGRLVLEGPVTIDWSKSPTVSLSKLSYVSADQTDQMKIGELGFQIELYPLIHGILVLRNLSLKNGRFVLSGKSGESAEMSITKSRVKMPVLQRVRLSNLSFEYIDPHRNWRKQAFLEKFTIDFKDVGGLLSIEGSGTLDDSPFSVAGDIGNLDIIAESKLAFPINVLLQLPRSSLAIAGSITQPRVGRGLSLDVKLDVEDFSQVLTSMGKKLPSLGRLTVDGRLTGDFSNPILSDAYFALRNRDSFQLDANGSIRDVFGEFDAEFVMRGRIADPHVIQWLAPEQMHFVDDIKLDGTVRLKPNIGYVDNLIFVASKTSNPMQLGLSGDMAFGKQDSGWRFTDVNLSLDADIQDLSAVLPELHPEYSRLVRLKLAGQLTGSQSSLRLTGINMNLSKDRVIALNATGEINNLVDFSDVELLISGTLSDSGFLGQWLPEKIANTARLEIQTKLTSSADVWDFHALNLKINNTEGFSSHVDGRVELVNPSVELKIVKADLNAQVMASSLANLADSIPFVKRQIGPLWGRAHILASTNQMSIENIDFELGEGPMFFSAKGRIDNVNDLQSDDWKWGGVDLELSLRSDEGRLDHWFQHPGVLRLSPFSIQGRYTGKPLKGYFNGEFRAAKSRISANITISNEQNKTQLSGDLKSDRLNLNDFGLTRSKTQKNRMTKPASTFFSRESLPIPASFASDLDFKISADQIVGLDSEITGLETGLTVKNSTLRIKSGRLNMAGNPWNFDASVSPAREPKIKFKLTANNINTALLTGGKSTLAPIKGRLFLSADLSSQGRSYYELASQLSGKIGLTLVKGEIKDIDFDLLALKIIKWAIPLLNDGDSRNVNCAVADFVFKDGLGRSSVFYVDTPDLTAWGEGLLDFKTETVDMMIRTEPKRSIFQAGLPVHISGLLVDPSAHPVPISAALQFAAQLALHPMSIPGKALGYVASLTNLLGRSSTQCVPG